MKWFWLVIGLLNLGIFLGYGFSGNWELHLLNIGILSLLLADAIHDRDKKAEALENLRTAARRYVGGAR